MRIHPLTLIAAVALAATPAAAAPPLAATWSGNATAAACGPDICLTATSSSCVAVSGDLSTTCSVTLTGQWAGTCDGIGTGSLVVTNANGDEQWTNATLVATGGQITYVARYAFLFDRTAVVATGVVDNGCAGGTWRGAFGGRGL